MSQTRRLAAILAADVAGYSRLMGADEVGTVQALRDHRSAADPLVAQHGGRVVKTTGDGALIEFSSVVGAVECALALQGLVDERNAGTPAGRRMEWRIGIHIGDVLIEGDDILGDGVNIAARLEGIAEPGGICISEDAFRQVRGKVEVEFADLGEQNLKNIAQPLRVYRVGSSPTAKQAISVAAALPLPDKPSIAVLPFANMSGDPGQEYFADGMVEEIITALSRLRWFFVIARNSTFTYKGRAVDVKQVGRELGVRYVLEGSVRKAGNRVRITAQLVEAATGNHVWAERYDRELADIFATQDEITERVVAAIEPQLYAAERSRSHRKTPESLDAWECVIRALSLISQDTRARNTEAEALCRRAIGISPGYGQAYSLFAWVITRRTLWSGDVTTVTVEANTAVRTALDLDERDPWAHLVHGMVLWRVRRHGDAVRAYRRALELNPNFALAHALLGLPLAAQGLHDGAVSSAENALRLSPNDRLVDRYASGVMVVAPFVAGEYYGCVAKARETVEKYPEALGVHMHLVAAAGMQRPHDAAAEALAELLRVRPDFTLAWARDNIPHIGEIRERFLVGLRRAGVSEE
jgi:TolB-like protein/class 3 adenylate cyclase